VDLRLAEVPFLAQVDVRAPAKGPAADAVGSALGVALPVEPGTSAAGGDVTVLWLGPDEWLAVGPPDTSRDLAARLRDAVGAEPASVVDVSARRTTIAVDGARARDLLAHGCSLDLHPHVFPVGRCAQTLVAHTQVIVVATDTGFRLMVGSSYAHHLADWLVDAGAEYFASG
jgi:sarcosine oxidase subunit gamma